MPSFKLIDSASFPIASATKVFTIVASGVGAKGDDGESATSIPIPANTAFGNFTGVSALPTPQDKNQWLAWLDVPTNFAFGGLSATVVGLSGDLTDLEIEVASKVDNTDSRLTDARTPLSHPHGNISNAGAIGTTADLPISTTASGVINTRTVPDFRTLLGLATTDSPTFAGVTVGQGSASVTAINTGTVNTGIWFQGGNNFSWVTAGTERIRLGSGGRISASDGIGLGGTASTPNVLLLGDAANTLVLRNSTNSQSFLVENTWTSSTNRETGYARWSSDVFRVGTEKGTIGGNPRALILETDGTPKIEIGATDWQVRIGNQGSNAPSLFAFSTNTFTSPTGGRGLSIFGRNGVVNGINVAIGGDSFTNTGGDNILLRVGNLFQPSSGTTTYVALAVQPQINQLGGSTGVSRGVNVSPTLTVAADWRSFDTDVNTGFAYHSSGTAPSRLGGVLTVENDSGSLAGFTTSTLTAVNNRSLSMRFMRTSADFLASVTAAYRGGTTSSRVNLELFAGGDSTNPPVTVRGSANSSTIAIGANYTLGWTDTNNSSTGTVTTVLAQDAANTLAQRNGTNAQISRIYKTFTSTTNFETYEVDAASDASNYRIGSRIGSAGGTTRGLQFGRYDAAGAWTSWLSFDSSGVPTFSTTSNLSVANGGVSAFALSATQRIRIGSGLPFETTTSGVTTIGYLGFAASNATSGPDVAFTRISSTSIEVNNGTAGTVRDLSMRDITLVPSASRTLSTNGQFTFETPTDTEGNLVYRGSDGTTRRFRFPIGVYSLPLTDGTNGQVLKTNGAGVVTWQNDATHGGGGGNISSAFVIAMAVAL